MSTITKRRVAAAAAVCALAGLGLTACSQSNSGSADSSEKPEASGDAIVYVHRLPDGEGMTPVADIVERWNKDHPDKKVESKKFDGKANEMIKKLETDIKGNAGPCLAQLGYSEVPELFTKGLVEDVSEYTKKYQDHFGPAYDLMTVGGKTVGLPQDVGPLVYMYNKAAFEELGLKVPTTSEELAEVAKAAAAKDKFAIAFEPDEAQNWLSAQAAAAGATWFGNDGDQWIIDTADPNTAKVAAFWQDILDSKAALVEERWGDGFAKAFADGKLIGTIAAAWEPALFASDFGSNDDIKGKWAVTQLPAFGAEPGSGPDGGSGVAVMKGCANKEAAVEFADWFNTQVDDLVTQGLVTAAATKQGTTPEAQKEFFGGQDIYAEFATATKNMKPIAYVPGFSTLHDPMTTAAADAVSGKGKVADIFTAAQDAAVKALKDYNLNVK